MSRGCALISAVTWVAGGNRFSASALASASLQGSSKQLCDFFSQWSTKCSALFTLLQATHYTLLHPTYRSAVVIDHVLSTAVHSFHVLEHPRLVFLFFSLR